MRKMRRSLMLLKVCPRRRPKFSCGGLSTRLRAAAAVRRQASLPAACAHAIFPAWRRRVQYLHAQRAITHVPGGRGGAAAARSGRLESAPLHRPIADGANHTAARRSPGPSPAAVVMKTPRTTALAAASLWSERLVAAPRGASSEPVLLTGLSAQMTPDQCQTDLVCEDLSDRLCLDLCCDRQ